MTRVGSADVGSGDRQTDLLTRDDQCSYHCTSGLGFTSVIMKEFQQCSRPHFRNACQSGVDSPCTHQSTKATQHQEDGELLVILMDRYHVIYSTAQARVCTHERITLEWLEDCSHQAKNVSQVKLLKCILLMKVKLCL